MDSFCMMMSDWLLYEPQTLLVLHHTGHGNHGSPFASKICDRKQKAFITSLGFDKKLRLEVHIETIPSFNLLCEREIQ